MLVEFKDFIKTLEVGEHFSIGIIDGVLDKSIGIYEQAPSYRIEAVGKESKYSMTYMRILIHWNKNLRETETAARSLFESLRYQSDFDMGEIHVNYIDLLTEEPIFVGTDENGVYEYVISLRIFYRR